jgi:diguanylate cyclase (GGDEF)-like protein
MHRRFEPPHVAESVPGCMSAFDTDLFDALPDHAAIVDRDGIIVRTNAAWQRYARENAGDEKSIGPGTDYVAVCLGAKAPGMHEIAQGLRALSQGLRSLFSVEYPCHSLTQMRWFLMRAGKLKNGNVFVIHTDITDRKLAELRAEELANHDALTSVLNRRGLDEHASLELSRMQRQGGYISALLLDCDNFKAVNTQFGHALGDLALAEIARRIRETLRPEDIVARIGGDEFIVLLPHTKPAEAGAVAERIRSTVSGSPLVTEGDQVVGVTVSLSVAEIKPSAQGVEGILRACRDGLETSKRTGKNKTSDSMVRLSPEAQQVATTEIHVARQAVIELATGKPVGHELLARVHSSFGTLQQYFKRANEYRVLHAADVACIRACVAEAARLYDDGAIHINVFPSTLLSLSKAEWLDWIPSYDLRRRICLELCEQEIVGDPFQYKERVNELRILGFSFAIDDVGFGRTCLENLVVLEPQFVKIDRRFVHGVSTQIGAARQLGRLLRLVNTLGAISVVEGIENQEDAETCRSLGAIQAQGFFWGQPSVSERK